MKKIVLLLALVLCATAVFGQSKGAGKDTTASATAFKMSYDDLFRHNADNSVSPKQPLMINGELVNTDTKITNGVKYGGVYVASFAGHDMIVDTAKGLVIIRRFLK
jgi:hypothetical protein